MKVFLLKNQLVLIGGVVIILCIVIFVSFFTLSDEEMPLSSPSTTSDPRTYQADQPVPGGKYQYATPEDEKAMAEDALVGTFVSELPYLGQYVRIDYSYADNKFTVKMDPDNVGLAEKEYDYLLNQKGISERMKLYNVEVFKD